MQRSTLFLVLTALLLVLIAPVAKAQTCAVAELRTASEFRQDLGSNACVFVDAAAGVTFAEAITPAGSERFRPVPTGLVDFGFGSARYWVRLSLRNGSDAPGIWWITHDLPIPKKMNVRLLRADGSVETLLSLSEEDPFGARRIPHRHLTSPVSLGAGETAELIIDYLTAQSTQMPLMAESLPAFMSRIQTETASHLFLITLMLGMGLISTIYFFSLEGWQASVYGAYVLVTSAMLAQMEGYLFQFVYPNWTWLNSHAFAFFGAASLSLGLLFLDRLTSTRTHGPRLHLVVLATVAALTALAFLSPVYLSTTWFKLILLGATVAASFVHVAVIIGALLRGQSGAWLLLMGFVAISGAVALVTVGYLTEGLFPQELAGSAIRGAHLLEAGTFSGAIALRIRDARSERDRSLQEELRLSVEQLRLSEALRKAEDERREAEAAAEDSQQALMSAAHDIRQPLASIQMALAGGAKDADGIAGSLSYIEGIVNEGLERQALPAGTGDLDPPQEGTRELFPVRLILGNVTKMLSEEAGRQGAKLKASPSSLQVHADPLVVMRAVSNLVSNAIAHSSASRILIGCRRRGGAVQIEIHDNGKGMTDAECARILERGARGGASSGYGLGTSIVKTLAEENDLTFALRSVPGRGTVAALGFPEAFAGVNARERKADA